MKIGLVPMAAKPYHAGHDALVRLAAQENDKVLLFVSTSDRTRKGEIAILGSDMLKIWQDYIEPALPNNIIAQYVVGPVTSVYDVLKAAEAENSQDEFTIYSDSEDILKYREASLKKAAPKIYEDNRIILRGVERSSTVDISGTEMRRLLASGSIKDKKEFISFLPSQIQKHGDQIYSLLAKRIAENLLKNYVKLFLC